jgi:predicted enzyme related to lactoylglutathione lyase
VSVVAIGACSGGRRAIPPVTPTPTGTYHAGKFVWYDLLTDDLPAAERFYSELFGWDFTSYDEDSVYFVITHQGRAIGGAAVIQRLETELRASRWLSLMSVPDVDGAVDLVSSEGGTVHMEPDDFPGRGRLALVADPQGAMFVLMRALGGDPADEELEDDVWMWTELWAHDVDAAFEFYEKLVGYGRDVVDLPGDRDYQVLTSEGRPRAGIIYLPWEEVTSNWLPYVKVADPAAIAGRVKGLGGMVILAPDENLRAGSVAVIADPSGAAARGQRGGDRGPIRRGLRNTEVASGGG